MGEFLLFIGLVAIAFSIDRHGRVFVDKSTTDKKIQYEQE